MRLLLKNGAFKRNFSPPLVVANIALGSRAWLSSTGLKEEGL